MVRNNVGPSNTYTSLSGVRREVRAAGRVRAVTFIAGIVLWLVGRFFQR